MKKVVYKIAAGVVAAGVLCLGYARFIEPNQLRIVHHEIHTNDRTSTGTIAFFTDTHLGKFYSAKNLEKITDTINQEKPDVILFGGDFFDNYARDRETLDLTQISMELDRMQAPMGKYAVWGNHDCGGGASRIYEETLEAGGFTVIQNEGIALEKLGIYLWGMDDALLGKPENPDIEDKYYRIIIGHEPDQADQIPEDCADLMLAGHSHGGQISLPILTEKILPIGAKKYKRGWYECENINLYVSSGIGNTLLPMRFGNIPEIIILTLTP
ncbi:MAG: metallophosphoesterase [Candidatus Merdivicinus sp.]